jgi:glucose-1-phosphate cytidylyltransferase
MKAVILAGGLGSRLAEETVLRPKPMVEIGGRPILWHIMKIYSAHGVNDFIVCCGYKGNIIKQYFANYILHCCDVTIDMRNNQTKVHHNGTEPWTVTLVDTGENTLTGGRLKRVKAYIGAETFCFTYGDGVSNIDIRALIEFHRRSELLGTLTAVQPPGRFGSLQLDGDDRRVFSYTEKPLGDGGWINGGFFVLEPEAIDYIEGDQTTWEHEPLRNLVRDGMLSAYRHNSFWHSMDTIRDKMHLEELWATGKAPWKVWK